MLERLVFAALLALAGCSSSEHAGARAPVSRPLDPEVFEPVSGEKVLEAVRAAVRKPGDGGLSAGATYRIKKPIPAYRIYSAAGAPKSGPLGSWWSLEKPTGTRAGYRADFAICTSWNDLDMLKECQLKVGTIVAIGPGQSASCTTGESYAASPSLQVFVATVDEGLGPCREGTAWP